MNKLPVGAAVAAILPFSLTVNSNAQSGGAWAQPVDWGMEVINMIHLPPSEGALKGRILVWSFGEVIKDANDNPIK